MTGITLSAAPALALQAAARAMLLVALVWAPVPLGSNRTFALALLVVWVWLALALAFAARGLEARAGQAFWPPAAQAAAPLLALAWGLCALVVLQQALHASGAWAAADPFGLKLYTLRTSLYAGLVLLACLVLSRRRHVLWVLGVLLGSGVLQSVVSAMSYARSEPFLFFFERFDPGRPSGTFPNADHMAGYLEITLAAGVGLLLALVRASEPARSWGARLAALAEFVMSPKMLVRLALVALVLALVLTRSRMGNGAFFLSIVLVGALVAWRSKRWRQPALWLVASMLVVDLIIIGQWVGLDAVVKRMQGTAEASSRTLANFGYSGGAPPPSEESLMQRLTVPFTSLPLVAERPLLGWGGGGYAYAYPAVKPDHVFNGFWDHAHNDYVQVAVDVGLPGLLLWASIGLASVWRAWRLLRDDEERVARGTAVAALLALSCLGLHSWVDFNLHIPANAATLVVLLTLLWCAPALPADARPRSRRRRDKIVDEDF